MIHVLLVDDHPSVGEGTKNMIESSQDFQVTVLSSGAEALELMKSRTFDLMLFDLHMPGLNGLELTNRVMSLYSDTIVMIYTGYDIGPHFNLLMESGVSGFINKACSKEQLLLALRCALRGDAVIPIPLLKQLRRKEVHIASSQSKTLDEVSINEKEQSILQLVSEGYSNKDIAAALYMSQRTVEYNLTRIFEKLSVRSRSEAMVAAKRLGLVRDQNFA